MTTRRLAGRVAIVTGAAAGIGAAIARAFVAEGARIVVADRDFAAATRTAAGFGDAAFAFDVDVTREPQVQALAEAARSRFGRIDIVGSSRVDLQACKLEYSIVSPK